MRTIPVSVDPAEQLNERRSLHYLHHQASEEISAYFEEDFWRFSLQANQSEPCIQHALIAVSSFYEAHELSQTSAIQTISDRSHLLTRFALQQCNRTISLLSRSTSPQPLNPQAVLLACLIFIWF